MSSGWRCGRVEGRGECLVFLLAVKVIHLQQEVPESEQGRDGLSKGQCPHGGWC